MSRHTSLSVSPAIRLVIVAMLPGMFATGIAYGSGVLVNILSGLITAIICNTAIALHPLVIQHAATRQTIMQHVLHDGSSLLTGILIALCVQPGAAWWITVIGTAFAIIVVKQCYGGSGKNLFNPAMAGYALIMLLFPVVKVDGVTGATALDVMRQHGAQTIQELYHSHPVFTQGLWAGVHQEWINLAFLTGGIFLLSRKVFTWHAPLAFLLTLSLLATVFYDAGSSRSHGSALFHLLSGATMSGAFFVITDPVTSAVTPRGKLLYGALIGALVFYIRCRGIYPDGISFAVLLGNTCAGLLDRVAQWQPGQVQHQHGAQPPIASAHRIFTTRRVIQYALMFTLASSVLAGWHNSEHDAILIKRGQEANAPITAVVPATTPDGYGGPVALQVSVNEHGVIKNVTVTAHQETRGLTESNAQGAQWLATFIGKSLQNTPAEQWRLRKENGAFDQMTGATVTSRAIVTQVHNTLQFVDSNHRAVFYPDTESTYPASKISSTQLQAWLWRIGQCLPLVPLILIAIGLLIAAVKALRAYREKTA